MKECPVKKTHSYFCIKHDGTLSGINEVHKELHTTQENHAASEFVLNVDNLLVFGF